MRFLSHTLLRCHKRLNLRSTGLQIIGLRPKKEEQATNFNRMGGEEGIHIQLHMAWQPAYSGTLLVQLGGTWRIPNCYCPWVRQQLIQMQITYYINDTYNTMDKLAFESPQRPHLKRTVDLCDLMMIRCWHVLYPKWLSHFVPICLENEVADCWFARRWQHNNLCETCPKF